MTLESRVVFIDTSVYRNYGYKFGKGALEKLQGLLQKNSTTLLITDITQDEINSHLETYCQELEQKINKLKSDNLLQIVTPEIDNNDILKIDINEIKKVLSKKIKDLLNEDNCETLEATDIDAKTVFSLYNNKKPPFGKDKKKSEFPDAFVLEKIRRYAVEKNEKVYIVSKDEDLKTYAEKYENLLYLDNLENYINLVVRADDKKEKDIQNFADKAFEKLQPELKLEAKEHLKQGDFIHNDLDFDLWVDENCTLNEIIEINILNKKLLDISEKHADYAVELECVFNFSYSEPNPENMHKDSLTKEWDCLGSIDTIATYSEKYSATLTIEYDFETKKIVQLYDFKFTDKYFILHEKNAKETRTEFTTIFDQHLDYN
jgi:hypothetical protein